MREPGVGVDVLKLFVPKGLKGIKSCSEIVSMVLGRFICIDF